MLSIKKIFLSLLTLTLLLGLTSSVLAVTPVSSNSLTQPEVYVRNLVLDKTVYKSGDIIKGSLDLYNSKDQAVSDVYAELTLAGDYQKNTLANVFYDSIKVGPHYLQGKETKKVDFTYTLPKAIAGDNLGIQASAILSTGFRMGWQDFMIKVEGETKILNITKAFISIGEEKFALEMGPVVYDTEKAFLEVTLMNPTKAAIEVTPKINVYNNSQVENTQVISTSLVKVAPGVSVSLKYDLPKFDNKGGVYVGGVSLLDSASVKRAVDFQFKYVIPGDIAVIKGLTFDKTVVTSGDTVKVTMSYSGPVFNVRRPATTTPAVYDVNIKLFSERNNLLAELNKPLDFSQGSQTTFNLKSKEAASSIRAEVVVKKGNTILAEYKSTPPTIAGQTDGSVDYKLIVYVILGLVVIVAVIFFIRKFVTTKHGK